MATVDPLAGVIDSMRKLIDQGKYAEAGAFGERAAISNYSMTLSTTYYAMLAAAHLGAGEFAAARLAVVRGNGEPQSGKALDFVGRLLESRNAGRYRDALLALRSAPEDVAEVFADMLMCELAATLAATYCPITVDGIANQAGVEADRIIACIRKKGAAFGIVVEPDRSVRRETAVSTAPRATASIDLVTRAALMTTENVDRYWN